MFNFETSNQNTLNELKIKAIQLIENTNNLGELKSVIFHLNTDKIKTLITKIISKKFLINTSDLAETITTSIISLANTMDSEIVVEFLEKCLYEGGVFDVHTLLDDVVRIQNFPLKRTPYRPIIETLLNINISNGNAAIGRGEIGIAFMCTNAFKGYTDISVESGTGMIPVEIKSTRNRNDFFMSAGTDQSSYLEAVNLLVDGVNSVGAKYAKTNKVKDDGIAQLNAKTANSLDYYFNKLGKAGTEQLLIDVLCKNYNQVDNFISAYEPKIRACIYNSGYLNYDKFKVVTSELNFDYYKLMSQHHGVLMLNVSDLTFTYQTSGDKFSKLVESNLITATSAIDFRTSGNGGLAFKMNL